MNIDGQIIELSHLDKLFYPRDGITKGAVIEYYTTIAGVLLPFVAHRCISMQRFPHGIDGTSFYHKDIPAYFPDFVDRYQVPLVGEGDKTFNTLVVCNSRATLVYLANQDVLTLHPWLSSTSDIHRPDKLIFDLDPQDGSFAKVIEVALALKAVLKSYDIKPFVMLTGSRGVHVVVPIVVEAEFAIVRAFVQKIAAEVVQKNLLYQL
jgi:bifunctional non-homologous end joining protein LigD